MLLRVPLGLSDFRALREQKLEYIDKTDLIREILDRPGAQVLLFPRPRRFGKTLNLSMLQCFFEKSDEDLSHLFQDLSIWNAGDDVRLHFQRYPLIHLTFRDVKSESFDDAWASIRKKIEVLFDAHRGVLKSGKLSEREARDYRAVVDGTAGRELYERALFDLSAYLHRAHGEKVITLIDEYDGPIHAGYVQGYASSILAFFRAFLTAGLKDNPHLFRAVVTGILRIARESIFSGLNNLAVYSLLRSEYSTAFGFTEPEVGALLEKVGQGDKVDVLRHWYNGYRFGGYVVYNPWSVLNFIADPEHEPRPYWLSTSSNDLIKQLLQGRAAKLEAVFESLLDGGGIERVLDENIVLDELTENDDALWSLLVFSGYLKAEKRSKGPGEQPAHWLTIPNREVRLVYTGTFKEWLKVRMRGHGADLDALIAALFAGDAETLEEQLQAFMQNTLSYHDAAAPSPEQLYHGFVLGLLCLLEPGYEVRSNRESGDGRPDVSIRSKQPGQPGVVLELKVAKPGKKTLDEALAQIRAKDYAAELRAAGATPVHAFAVAFDRKRVLVRTPEG